MPREQQKRGRRAEKKAQKEDSKRKFEETPEDPVAKRMKPSADDADETNETNEANDDVQLPENEDYIPLDQGEEQEGERPNEDGDMVFYGLLDEEESEYFQRANEMLELNQFQDAEERSLFVDSVYAEASGKELKIACSQGCSRLMEKLISMSDARQLRRIFSKFIGHFLHLVQHRFASHCCETLFIHAAPAVMQKTKSQPKKSDEEGEEEPELSLAEMFMAVIEELKENWGYLLTERFASHTIRVLLLVLAGEPVDVTSNESFVASRKKERIEIPTVQGEEKASKSKTEKHAVPEAFEPALKKIMTDMVSGLDDVYLRALATHPVGNPVLQVLLFLELSHFGKSSAKDPKSTIRRLVPDESFEEESESAVFIRGLLYDPVGSRLLETMVRYLPGKSFKNLYRNNLGDRIGSLSRNSTAGYVVLRMLERLGKDDLKIAMTNIIPEVPGLIERSRLIVPKMLIERCVYRGVDTKPLAEALEAAYSQDPVIRLQQMLKFKPSENTAPQSEDHDMDEGNDGKDRKPRGPPPISAAEKAEKLHGSLLAQAMLTVPGPLSQLVYTSLLAQSSETIVQLAQETTSSRVLQQALTSTTSTPQIRRQLTTRFQGHLTPLALSASGSHVVDALWTATKDIFFVKERMAQELEQHEQELRDSFVGRAVWRNWSMDLFKRRRRDWAHKAKGLEERTESNEGAERPKSKLEQARARYAAAKEAADAGATGANQTAVASR